MESAFRKFVFGRKTSGEAERTSSLWAKVSAASAPLPALHPALTAEAQRIDLFRPGMGRKAVHYVATGDHAEVVDATAAARKAMPLYQTPHYKDSASHNAAVGASDRAVVTGEVTDGGQVARLLDLRIAIESVSKPYWLNNPTHDQMMRLAFSGLINSGVNYTRTADYKTLWDRIIPLRSLFELVRGTGGTVKDLFELVLARTDSETLGAESWVAVEDFAGFARTYPAALVEAIRAITADRRMAALKVLHHHQLTSLPETEELLLAMLARPFSKQEREATTSALARLDPAALHDLLSRRMSTADIDTRYGLVQAAARSPSPEILTLLADRAQVEKAGKVKAAIDAALEATQPPAHAAADGGQAEGYAAIDGTMVPLPPRKDLGEDHVLPPTDEACIAFVDLVGKIEARRQELHAQQLQRNPKNASYTPFSRENIEAAFAAMTEGLPTTDQVPATLVRLVRHHEDGQKWFRAVLERLPVRARLKVLQATRSEDLGGVIGTSYAFSNGEKIGPELLREWIAQDQLDLRDIAEAKDLRQLIVKEASRWGGSIRLELLSELQPQVIWPWLFESSEVFDEALGLRPAQRPLPLDIVLSLLAFFPAVPQRYLPRLLEIAVAEKRPLRRQAMALLRPAQDLTARLEALLDDKRQQVRINAAAWLADVRSAGSEGALRKRMKKEKSDPVRAALIQSLQRLGADLADVVGPALLIAEAEAASAKAAPVLPDWIGARGIPPVRFRDGSTAPALLVQHWLSLAIRLKDPAACGQFGIYLDQLDPADATAFSNWVLDAWVAYDTHSPSIEEANAHAKATFASRHAYFNGKWTTGSNLPSDEQALLIARLARDKANELLNSGTDTKGMLALACRADPVFAANRVRWFLKKHGRRSNQAMALLEVLAGIGQPAALQVVIAASARLKQKSTQARAAEIAQRYAEDRGWSFDELADRTVPTAGFDDDGELELLCGEDSRLYMARLDAMLAIHLFNPDGKPVKALPSGDDDATKESKKAFTAAKKELAQVVELQGTRLFEAMCVERAWPVADWRMAFHEHPVMRRLVERLVWQGLDAEGAPLGLFRPTQEGDFTDAADAPVDIDGFASVRLAHGALVDEATCAAWSAHLKDYEVTPFIAQFDTLRAPLSPEQGDATAIEDRLGWKADSRTYRGLSEKRGYERVMRDGGGCNEYAKKFPSHGITATIFHTGSYAVDENNPVALKDLRFSRGDRGGDMRLKDVPPVMLAECWADYHAIAAKGAFDPEWEKVSPW